MKISIIIVSWNVKDHLCACIDSIKNNLPKATCEIIVVDNASRDGTAEHLQKKYPEVKTIASPQNLGFGAGNNLGARHATGEYLFILNPDTLVQGGTLDGLIKFMDENTSIAMCGPRVLNEDGSAQRSVRNFQTWKAAFCRYTPLKHFGIFKNDLNHWRFRNFNYEKQQDVEQLIGAALFVRKKAFDELSGFDERFFMYYEEVDLCYRIVKSGQRNVYFPDVAVVHIGGRSSSQIPARKQFMILESLIKYLKKHSSPSSSAVLSILFKIGILLLQLFDLVFYSLLFVFASLLRVRRKKEKYQKRASESAGFLFKYYWKLWRLK